MNFDVKVHTSDRNISAIMVIQANSVSEAKAAAVKQVKTDHPHVLIREVVAEPSVIVPEQES